MIDNLYPELPEVPYEKVAVPAEDVIACIGSMQYKSEVKRVVYAISANESGNFKSFVNTNGAGIQADDARWSKRWDPFIIGTTVQKENLTGKGRRFLVFKQWQNSIIILAWYMNDRGIYIGGNTSGWANINPISGPRLVPSAQKVLQVDLYTAYLRAWVLGDEKANPKLADIVDFTSLYKKAEDIFK